MIAQHRSFPSASGVTASSAERVSCRIGTDHDVVMAGSEQFPRPRDLMSLSWPGLQSNGFQHRFQGQLRSVMVWTTFLMKSVRS